MGYGVLDTTLYPSILYPVPQKETTVYFVPHTLYSIPYTPYPEKVWGIFCKKKKSREGIRAATKDICFARVADTPSG